MSIKLKNVKEAKEAVVHSLPCKIHADMESDVDSFFKPVQVSDKELTASFRGYPLSGTRLELSEGYKGFIFNDSKDPKPSSYSCVGQFKNFTYWNWDKPPSKNDPVIATMDWLTLSGAIHDPIDIEDV
ncbi:uncharacterized protein LOC106672604 [Cimex lectularius]|uniref:Uncharacterized protein n=1 Tax=Cimex lectularius TaxID=79782 RepID=A0A8I6SE98_CIMLE|nr:uncharacterized protein LOC106672604 [Cimex lectularius]